MARAGDDSVRTVGRQPCDSLMASDQIGIASRARGQHRQRFRTAGIAEVVQQQLAYADLVLQHRLVPILEPEIDISSTDKRRSEDLLKARILTGLDALPDATQVILKISIPDLDGLYSDVMEHPRMMRVVALSGGYSRREADERLRRNPGLIASFSRALAEGLSAQQSDEEFDATLQRSVDEIYAASIT